MNEVKATEDLKQDRIQLRATTRQVQEIDEAAAAEQKTRSDFMLDASIREAQRVLMDRRLFLLGDSERDEFLRPSRSPTRREPRLGALFQRGSVLGEK